MQRSAYAFTEPFLVCTAPESHDDADVDEGRARQESDWERQRAERQAEQARRDAAEQARLDWLSDHLTAAIPNKGFLADMARAVMPQLDTA